ncbi:MAG: hypothetical protein OEV94_06360 [Deltaproteobacteria bacterium]|nr:hypothetical protein [Deltaproteobacteria bacterium]
MKTDRPHFEHVCDKTPLVERMAVDHPEVLTHPEWRNHMAECQPCRDLWRGLERSLAAFVCLERETRHRVAPPDWNAFQSRLQTETRRHAASAWMRLPLAAAMAGLFLVSGLAMFNFNPAKPESTLAAQNRGNGRTAPVTGLIEIEHLSPGEDGFEANATPRSNISIPSTYARYGLPTTPSAYPSYQPPNLRYQQPPSHPSPQEPEETELSTGNGARETR